MAVNKRALAKPAKLKILGPSFELHPTGLTVVGKPTKEEYEEAFGRLEVIEGAIHWWYGDLCLAYEGQYGAIAEIAEASPFQYQTIANDKYVASRYEVSQRWESLSIHHHRIAAPIDPLEQRLEWLRKAEEGDGLGKPWSTRRLELEIQRDKRVKLLPPAGVYDVIYADPPWQYSNVLPQWGPAELHYRTLSIEELCDIKIPSAENAVLFLWVTNPFLRDAFQVIDAWGFEYKTNIVWVKRGLKKPGSGFWVRGRHELLFICSRGSFVPDQTGKEPIGSVIEEGSVIEADVQEHSRKPEMAYELIEKMYPDGRYLELFARNTRLNWISWGSELNKS